MATKLHKALTDQAELHPNKIDSTTGTELTVASQTTYDGRWPKGKVYSATITSTVTNTTVDTSFSQNYTLPANTLTPGKMVRVTSRGVYSSAASASGQLNFSVKLGSTTVTTGGTSQGDGKSNRGFAVQGEIICLSSGVSGTVEAQGMCQLSSTANGTFNIDLENAAPITLDTTTSQTVAVSAQWSAALAGNTVTQRVLIIEVFG